MQYLLNCVEVFHLLCYNLHPRLILMFLSSGAKIWFPPVETGQSENWLKQDNGRWPFAYCKHILLLFGMEFFLGVFFITCHPHRGETWPPLPPLVRVLLRGDTWSQIGRQCWGSPGQPTAWPETPGTAADSDFRWWNSSSEFSPEGKTNRGEERRLWRDYWYLILA